MTDPLVPPEVDLRGLPWMPLDIVRLFDSDTYALCQADKEHGGLAFMCSVRLWAKSWHEQPAASLTANESILAEKSGAGALWERVREIVMRGWVTCSDGRLYHPVVAEAALRAWEERLTYLSKREADAKRLDKWRKKQRANGTLSKKGGKKVDGPRGTETGSEGEVKRVSTTFRNDSETNLSRREETGKRQGSEEKPVEAGGAPANPDLIAEFPATWKPCKTSLEMLKQHALPEPQPEHVAAFVGHWHGRSIAPRRIPGEFLKWMAKQRAFDARDGTGVKAAPAPTGPRRQAIVQCARMIPGVGRCRNTTTHGGFCEDCEKVTREAASPDARTRAASSIAAGLLKVVQ